MKGRILLVGVAMLGLLIGSGVGHAATSCSNTTHSCSGTDADNCVVEPIETRSDAAILKVPAAQCGAPVDLAMNGLSNVNISAFTMSASGGSITATITTKGPLIRGTDTLPNVLPYSGQHVMLMFQTNEFQVDHVIGQGATGGDVHWGPPGYNADHFYWFMYYGWNASELRDLCGLGYYDPTGEFVSPIPVFFGQTFFIVGQVQAGAVQQPTATCTFSGNTVTIRIPYTYKWSDGTGTLRRQVPVVVPGESIQNISAFSWLDHEIGGPDPVGLILGWTWYADALPQNSYKYGLIAGDPNPSVIGGPKCFTNPDPNPVTGEPPGPCTIDNPVGTGFRATGLNFVAG